ncbi:MAG: histidine--tRNA ligase [Candidatus Westeberhardia cardiocondylae]|nr:histidine--tRNA ligase [Candidatus Westeberhardia cardiocondylae]
MIKKIQSIRGMHDFFYEDTIYFQHIENTFKKLVTNYGYYEIRLPVLEYSILFEKTMTLENNISKEMYTFVDKNKKNITIRPEGTASCVRSFIQHGLFRLNQQQFWYIGPMFRHEKPQKGRYRQFYQLGIEKFGCIGPNSDIELILMINRWWKILGINKNISLEINFLGEKKEYEKYKKELTKFFIKYENHLDNNCKKYIKKHPMKILNKKNIKTQRLLDDAPKILNFLNKKSKKHFDNICKFLDRMNISYKINPNLMRGLGYYNNTIFEWITYDLGKKITICGGGRYDCLINKLGGPKTPAIGLSAGLERLSLLIKLVNPECVIYKYIDIYIITTNHDVLKKEAILLSEYIRDTLPSLNIMINYKKQSISKQFKKANKLKSKIVLFFGEKENEEKIIILKDLKKKKQKILKKNKIIKNLKIFFNI